MDQGIGHAPISMAGNLGGQPAGPYYLRALTSRFPANYLRSK